MNTTIRLVFRMTLAFLSAAGVGSRVQAVVPPPDGCYPAFTTAEGCSALSLLTTGAGNTAVGWRSLFSASTASFNTGVGAGALALNNGESNTAVGAAALLLNTSGSQNVAVGTDAMVFNLAGQDNTAVGAFALNNNTSNQNTALGSNALFSNTLGIANTAIGAFALASNNGGQANTAIGVQALSGNINANSNTAMGDSALSANTTGTGNTAIGSTAMAHSATGSGNVALGNNAGINVTTASNVICIGSVGKDLNNSCFITSIHGVQTQNANAIPVVVDSDNQLGTVSSSRRFKKDIEVMTKDSEAILALKPVTFHYKTDKTNTPQFGLIAEEVAKVNPDLIVRDENGEIYTVRYDAVNAMLLNEFLKEHNAFLEEQKKVQNLEAALAAVNERLKEQDAKIEKVSAGIMTNTMEPQVARVP
jgi:trimeric autotransporter adhesin